MQLSTTVSDLRVLVDGQLSMANHVASLCWWCFFQLRQLRLVSSSQTDDSAKTLVHAFISSRLDYCNSVLYSVSGRLLRKLQTVQNAAARCNAVKKVRPHHASAERAPLAAHGTACAVQAGANCFQVPPWPGTVYLTDDCVFVSSVAGRRPLRSADTRTLYVPRPDSYCHRRQELCSGWPTCMEQSAA